MKKILFISFLCLMFAMFSNITNAQNPAAPDGCCFWLEQIDPEQVYRPANLDSETLESAKYYLNPVQLGPDGNYAKVEYYYFRFVNDCMNPKTKLSIDWEFFTKGRNDLDWSAFDNPLDATPSSMRNYMNVEIEWNLPLLSPAAPAVPPSLDNYQGSGPLLSGRGLNAKNDYVTINNVKRAVKTDFPGQIDASQFGALYGYFNPYQVQNRWYNYIYADFLEWACQNNYLRIKITRYSTIDIKANFKLIERIGGIDFQEYYIPTEQNTYMGGHGAAFKKEFMNFWLKELPYITSETVCAGDVVNTSGMTFVFDPRIPDDPYIYILPILNPDYQCIDYFDSLKIITWNPRPDAPTKVFQTLCTPGIAEITAIADYEDDFEYIFNWYADKDLENLLYTGKTINHPCLTEDKYYHLYVTATYENCEGPAQKYVIWVPAQFEIELNDARMCTTLFEEDDNCIEVIVPSTGAYGFLWTVNEVEQESNTSILCLELSGECNDTYDVEVVVTDLNSNCPVTAQAIVIIQDEILSFEIEDAYINSDEGSLENMFECAKNAHPDITGYPHSFDMSCPHEAELLDFAWEDVEIFYNCEDEYEYTHIIERTWTVTTPCGIFVQGIQMIYVSDVDAPRSIEEEVRVITTYGDDCTPRIPEGTIESLKELFGIYDNCTQLEEIEVRLITTDGETELADEDPVDCNNTLYYVEAIDACGNISYFNMFFDLPTDAFNVTILADMDEQCNTGENSFELVAVVENGSGEYTFEWTSNWEPACEEFDADIENPEGESTIVNPVTDIECGYQTQFPTYTVEVTDLVNSCVANYTITLTLLPLPKFVGELTYDILCYGGTTMVSVEVEGGNPPYTYYYEGVQIFHLTGPVPTPLPAGEHVFTVQDTKCENSATYIVNQPDEFIAEADIDEGNEIKCYGGTAIVTIKIEGGTPPFFYNEEEFEGTFDIEGLVAGEYEFILVDANGCETSTEISITEPDEIVINAFVAPGDEILCYEGTATLTIEIEGGTPPYYYNDELFEGTISGLVADDYEFELFDANDCPFIVEFTIEEPTEITFLIYVAQGDEIQCHGGTATVTIDIFGGTPPYYYNGEEFEGTISGLVADDYEFILYDANDCPIIAEISIEQPDEIEFDAYIAPGDEILCYGGTATLTVEIEGGTAPYFYNSVEFEGTITGLLADDHTLTIFDSKECPIIIEITIDQPTAITYEAYIAEGDEIFCYGGTATLTVDIEGGTPPYYYNDELFEGTIEGLLAGTYTFSFFDTNECELIVVKTIEQPDELVIVSIVGTNQICVNGDGEITVNATGGTGNLTYRWNTGATTPNITDLSIGDYSVVVKDENDCKARGNFNISFYGVYPIEEFKAEKNCNDDFITVTVVCNTACLIQVQGYNADTNEEIPGMYFSAFTNSLTHNFPFLVDPTKCIYGDINFIYFTATATIEPCVYEADPSETLNVAKVPVLYVYETTVNNVNHDPLDNIMGEGEVKVYANQPITHYFRVDDFCNSGADVNLSVNYTYYINGELASPINNYLTTGTASYMRFFTPIPCGYPDQNVNYSNISHKSFFPFSTSTSGWYYQATYFDFFKLGFFDGKEIRVELPGFNTPGVYTVEYELVTHRAIYGGCAYGATLGNNCIGPIGGIQFHAANPGYEIVVLAKNTMTIVVSPASGLTPFSNKRDPNVTVYPNPATNDINLSFTDVEGDAKVSIVSISGAIVHEQQIKVDNSIVNIKFNEVSPGFYFVYVKSDDAVLVRKLIIEQK